MQEEKPSFKVVMLGDSGVGKTSLVNNWITSTFQPYSRSTVSANHQVKNVSLDGKDMDVVVWDTAGQEQFQALTPLYARSASAAILVISVDDEYSFNSIQNWKELLSNSCDEVPPTFLAINKIDLSRDSNQELIEEVKTDFEGIYYVSAKTGEAVDTLFLAAAQSGYRFSLGHVIKPITPVKSTRDGCC